MLAEMQSGWLNAAEGAAGGIVSLLVLGPVVLKVFRPLARWVWRKIVTAVADVIMHRMTSQDRVLDEINRKVSTNGGTETDSVGTETVRLRQAVEELTEELRGRVPRQ